MATIDLTIVLIYIAGLFSVGVFVGIRETADDFLVLSRRAGFFLVLASVVSSWVGVGMFVGTSASAYDTGISLGLTGAAGALVAVVAAGFFAPRVKDFGDRYNAHTLGDFLRFRYSPAISQIAAVIIIVVYLLLTAVQFSGLTALLSVWAGMGFKTAMVLTAVSTIIYTAFAGIKSDFYTDAIHFVVMVLVLFGLLLPKLWAATDSGHALWNLPHKFFDPFAFGGVAYFVGGLILGIAIVFVSMDVWQRIYASSSAQTAKSALIASGFVIVPFYALAVIVGLAGRALNPGIGDSNLTLFTLMRDYLGPGALGLGLAAFIALFVSSANTMMMVVSATLTKDLVAFHSKGRRLLMVGRLTTIAAGIGGLVISLYVRSIVTLSVVAIFLLLVLLPAVLGGFYWRRATAKAAGWSIVGGTIAYFAMVPVSASNAFAPGFAVSLVLYVAISYFTKHHPAETFVEVK